MKYIVNLLFSVALLFSPVSIFAQSLPQLLQEHGQVRMIDLKTDMSSEKAGIMGGSSTPDVDVYVFADLTEGNYSGKILTQNIPYLLEKYPKAVRVWYIHTVLPYRDTSNNRNAITTMTCLGKENRFWKNIDKIVETKGQWDVNYVVDNQETYRTCLSETNVDAVLSAVVKRGQAYMSKYDMTGVPTALFVAVKNPGTGIIMSGAYPSEVYSEAVEQIQADAKKQNGITITPTIYPIVHTDKQPTAWVRFGQFIQSFFHLGTGLGRLFYK